MVSVTNYIYKDSTIFVKFISFWQVYVLHLLTFVSSNIQTKSSFFPCVQDDMQIRVFNYNTLERVHMFEAHSDYIRCIAVHPTQPYILTSSGMLFKVFLITNTPDFKFIISNLPSCQLQVHIYLDIYMNDYVCFYTDDMLIKLWDWEKKWSCSQVFEGHTHYVMQIVINPKDNNQFASASLDRTIKVHFFSC